MAKKIILGFIYTIGFITILLMATQFLSSSTTVEEEENEDSIEKKERVIFTPPNTPKKLVLFGERMPLEYNDVYESLDREVYTNCYYHSSTINILKLVPRFFPTIKAILKEEGIPEDFIYLAVAESRLSLTISSPAGAVGFWQFMKKTAPEYGLEVNNEVDERYHLEKSTRAACKYFKKSYTKFGSWTMVAASFNAGNTGISQQIERQKEDNYYNLLLNQETARYVFRIAALKLIIENPVKYGFNIPKYQQYKEWETRNITISNSISSFPDWCKENGTNYKILKILNPWLRDDKLENKLGKTYTIKLPLKGERI